MWYGVSNTGLPNPVAAFVEALSDSSVNVIVGAAEIGQGSATVMTQIAAETLGLAYDDILVTWADTQIAPEGGATSASRQTFISGNAVKNACLDAMSELKKKPRPMFWARQPSRLSSETALCPPGMARENA